MVGSILSSFLGPQQKQVPKHAKTCFWCLGRQQSLGNLPRVTSPHSCLTPLETAVWSASVRHIVLRKLLLTPRETAVTSASVRHIVLKKLLLLTGHFEGQEPREVLGAQFARRFQDSASFFLLAQSWNKQIESTSGAMQVQCSFTKKTLRWERWRCKWHDGMSIQLHQHKHGTQGWNWTSLGLDFSTGLLQLAFQGLPFSFQSSYTVIHPGHMGYSSTFRSIPFHISGGRRHGYRYSQIVFSATSCEQC